MSIIAMNNLIKELDIKDFDVVLVGDGSGTIYKKASSWACWHYLKSSGSLDLHFGTFSFGTNNFAELIPYVSVLWLDAYTKPAIPRDVVIVSDSELTVKQGTGEYAKNANGILWSGLDYARSAGYNITWKHVKRNSNPLNAKCDEVAGRLRKEIDGFKLTRLETSDRIKQSDEEKQITLTGEIL